MFLTKCLRIASQDVRLYKTQLEDKVSKWLSDSWTVTGATRGTIILNTVSDILVLLETIAGLSKQTDLHFRFVLPFSPIVDSMRMEKRVKIIRDYLLSASLPSCTHDDQPQSSATSPTSIDQAVDPGAVHMTPSSNDVRLEARPRERKVSAYFSRTLDTLLGEWKSRVASTSHIPVEAARQALDFAIAAIAFECALTVNSTLSNSRVLKTAGELLSGIVVYTKESRWTLPEKMSILLGLETIVSASGAAAEGPWEAIAPSDYDNDGMVRKERVSNHETPLDLSRGRRNALLRAIWQSNDVGHKIPLVAAIFKRKF
jgi:ataxia telangiectasia mutated family protein